MPLYQVPANQSVLQIKPMQFKSERELQSLFEANLETLLGVRFIASEFTTGDRQRGRIDTLGLDQDGYPTIIEYKKTSKENVINQGLFYLDWLVDHKGDFTIAAQEALGTDISIDWGSPRLILVAESFSEYDKYAVNRIGANIDLWAFRRYGDELLYLETIFSTNARTIKPASNQTNKTEGSTEEAPLYTIDDHLQGKSTNIQELFEALRERILAFDEDEIIEKANKMYIGYKHGKNFCEVKVQSQGLKMWLDIAPEDLHDPLHLSKDVRDIGHHGTGDTEVRLASLTQLESVLKLIEQAYQQTV